MRLTNRRVNRRGDRRSRRYVWGLAAFATLAAIAGPAVALTSPAGASTPTITVTPDTNLTGNQTVSVAGSGFADSSEGSVLECNDDPSQPTIEVAGIEAAPVGCTDPLNKIIATSSTGTISTTFTVKEGVVGPPATGTDSSGGNAATDAEDYPCPPTPAQVADGVSCNISAGDEAGNTASQVISFSNGAGPLTITTTSLPSASQTVSYSATLAATGGTLPYTWSIASGELPAGLSLDTSTGVISGTPTTIQDASFTVEAVDDSTPTESSTVPLSILVEPANSVTPTVTITENPASPNPVHTTVTLTATVTGANDVPPTQGVNFTDEDYTGTGTSPKLCGTTGTPSSTSGSSSVFSCQTSFLFVGNHTITADYTGNVLQGYNPASGTSSYSVGSDASVQLYASPLSPQKPAKHVKLTAAVTGVVGEPTPTGTVTFSSGSTTLCEAATLKNGLTSCKTNSTVIGLGTHSITASYSGDENYFSGTSPAVSYQIRTPTSVTTTLSPSRSVHVGSRLTVKVTVTAPSASITPTGTVKLLAHKGAKLICEATLSGGKATCGGKAPAGKGKSVWVSYTGNQQLLPSKSAKTPIIFLS